MRPIRSLALRTELLFHRHDGRVEDRGDHVVVRTPANPGYYWGNFLLFDGPPRPGDLTRWTSLFRAAFADDPRVRHMSFGWDDPDGAHGASEEFVREGFERDDVAVLTAREVRRPPRECRDVVIRRVESDAEWQAVVDLQVRCRHPRFDEARYRAFKVGRFDGYRRMSEGGHGAWWGAYRDGELAADLGLFFDDAGSGIGRFQAVETHPEHRRLGLCGTLVHAVADEALRAKRAETLVMCADESYHAAAIYESVGFRKTERLAGVFRAP